MTSIATNNATNNDSNNDSNNLGLGGLTFEEIKNLIEVKKVKPTFYDICDFTIHIPDIKIIKFFHSKGLLPRSTKNNIIEKCLKDCEEMLLKECNDKVWRIPEDEKRTEVFKFLGETFPEFITNKAMCLATRIKYYSILEIFLKIRTPREIESTCFGPFNPLNYATLDITAIKILADGGYDLKEGERRAFELWNADCYDSDAEDEY